MPGQGAIIAAGAIEYPAGLASLPEDDAAQLGRLKSHDADEHLRPSRHSRRRIGRVPAAHRSAARRIGRFLRIHFLNARVAAPERHPQNLNQHAVRGPRPADQELTRAAAAGVALIMRYRTHGVNAAHLDPLADTSPFDPALEPASLGLDHALMLRVPASVLRVYAPGENLADVIERLARYLLLDDSV